MDDPFGDISGNPIGDTVGDGVSDAGDAQLSLDGTKATVDECAALIAEIEERLHGDVLSCLNTCHGDVGLCQSCILGDIASYVQRAGISVTDCGNKIVNAVNGVMSEVWGHATAIGVPPPTQEQINAVSSGQPIPDAVLHPLENSVGMIGSVGDAGVVPVNVSVGDGTVITLPCQPAAPSPQSVAYLIQSTGGVNCIPADWGLQAITTWCILAYGNDPSGVVVAVPTLLSPGIWQASGCFYQIPPLCNSTEAPSSPTGSGGTASGTGGTGGTAGGNGGTGSNGGTGGGTGGTASGPAGGTGGGTGGGGTGGTGPGGGSTGTASGGGTPANPNGPIGTGGSGPAGPQPSQVDANACGCSWLMGESGGGSDLSGGIGANGDGTCWAADGAGNRITWTPSQRAIDNSRNNQNACIPTSGGTAPSSPTPTIPPAPKLSDFCNPTASGDILEAIAGLDVKVSDGLVNDLPQVFAQKFGLENPDNVGWTDFLTNPINAGLSSLIGAIFKIPELVLTAGDIQSTAFSNCISPAFTVGVMQTLFTRPFGGWFGLVPPQVTTSNEYYLNLICQYRIPSTMEADRLLSRGYITDTHWNFLVRANGDCVPWQEYIVQSQYTRIGIQDAYRLWKLGKITANDFIEAWKRQGIDFANDREKWNDAIQQYPGMADLIRFMTRDVADEATVQTLGLDGVGDTVFESKWTGLIQQWGNAQGVSDEVARNYYRAHWQNPGTGNIYEWLHRFRPDDRNPNDPNANLVFSESQASSLLGVADYMPGLLKYYIAAAYRPPSRRDISRLYRTGVYKDVDDIRRAFLDLGSTPQAAQQLAEAVIITEGQPKAKADGQVPAAEVLRMYRADLVTIPEAQDLLNKAGMTAEQALTSLEATDARRRSDSRKTVAASLKKRYMRGEFTDAQASQQLVDAFMDQQQATDTVKLWSAERLAKEKSPTIAMLCRWYGKGMLTIDAFMQRVTNLNYNPTDALTIVQSCQGDVQAKRDKEIQAELAKQQKIQQANARDLAKQIREAKQAARALKLQHVIQKKLVVKSQGDTTTTTTTNTVIDKPDVNLVDTNEQVHVDVSTSQGTG